jgi:hypothetical protein
MNSSPVLWFPAGRFFNDGRLGFALVLVALQATIVFWPLAVSLARRHMERLGVERLLAELAEAHRPNFDEALPMKSFRKAA